MALQHTGKLLKSITLSLVITLLSQQLYPTILAAQTGGFEKMKKHHSQKQLKRLKGVFSKASHKLNDYKRENVSDEKKIL